MLFRRKPQRAWLLLWKQRLFSNTIKKLFLSWVFNDPDCPCVCGGVGGGQGGREGGKKMPREVLPLKHWLINQLILGYAQALSSPKCGKSRSLCVSLERTEAGRYRPLAFGLLFSPRPILRYFSVE